MSDRGRLPVSASTTSDNGALGGRRQSIDRVVGLDGFAIRPINNSCFVNYHPSRKGGSAHTMPTAKCFYCSVDADVKSLKKCGACGSVTSETARSFVSALTRVRDVE